MELLGAFLATLLLLLFIVLAMFLVVGLIHFFLCPPYWLHTWIAYLQKSVLPYLIVVRQQWVTFVRGNIGQRFHRLAHYLESPRWLLVLKVAELIGVIIAAGALVLTYLAFKEDAHMRQKALEAFNKDDSMRKRTLEVFEEEREARAWSLIYQSKGSPGDGGRIYALQYLSNKKKANLGGLPLANAYLVGIELPRAKLSEVKLRGAKLSKVNLYEANLSKADLHRADLRRANLYEANLSKADLRKANLYETNLYRAYLRGADLRGADLRGADLRGADLEGADLRGAKLYRANLRRDNLVEANFSLAKAGQVLSVEGILSWAEHHGIDPSSVGLRGAKFPAGTSLGGADLRKASLHGADLSEAYLGGANLHEAKLNKANLRETILNEANLSGADLRWTENLTQEQIDHAFFCEQWPPPKLSPTILSKLMSPRLPPLFEFELPPTRKCTFWGDSIEE